MIDKLLARIPFKLFVIICLFLASFFLFAFIVDEVIFDRNDVYDNLSTVFFTKYSTPALVSVMRTLTNLGSSYFLLPAYLVLISYLLFKQKKRRAIDIAIVASSSFLVMQAMKRLFRRDRPESATIEGLTTYSFPSGHSLSAFVFFGILGYLLWRGNLSMKWKFPLVFLLIVLAMGVGMSRIILGVHYTTDVIAGFCLGMMWVILSFWILRRVELFGNPAK